MATQFFIDDRGRVVLVPGLGGNPVWEPAYAWTQTPEGEWKNTGTQKMLDGKKVWQLSCTVYDKAGAPQSAKLFALGAVAPTVYTDDEEIKF